jgi:hypothetical protein
MINNRLEALVVNESPYTKFGKALETFANDYAIVGHAGDPVVSIFGVPREGRGPDHKYTVTNVPETMTEDDFKEAIGNNPVVIINMCMDARGAVDTYKQLAQKARAEFSENVVIILLAHGGGIIQVDEAIRDGQRVKLNRETASKNIYGYLAKYAKQIVRIHAGGHDCRCGACAFYNDGVGVPEVHNIPKGSQDEIEIMQDKVFDSAQDIIPDILKKKVKLFVAHFNLDENDTVKILEDKRQLK